MFRLRALAASYTAVNVVIGRVESLEIGPYSIALPVARFSAARGGSLARTDFDPLSAWRSCAGSG